MTPTFKPIFGWDVVTVPEELVAGAPAIVALVKVDYTPYQKAASASQLDINAALEDLNKSRATYTDVESAYRFVLDVPAGSTGNIALAFATPDAFGYGDQIKLRLDAVGTAEADGNYDPASIPAFTTITGGWSMSVSPTPLVAGEKGVVLLTKNPL